MDDEYFLDAPRNLSDNWVSFVGLRYRLSSVLCIAVSIHNACHIGSRKREIIMKFEDAMSLVKNQGGVISRGLWHKRQDNSSIPHITLFVGIAYGLPEPAILSKTPKLVFVYKNGDFEDMSIESYDMLAEDWQWSQLL